MPHIDDYEYRKRLAATRTAAGLCAKCGVSPPDASSVNCSTCKSRIAQYHNDYNNRVKLEVYAAYGSRCSCCGDTRQEYFTLDHINDDGKAHRQLIGADGGPTLWKWLKRNNFPSMMQILCANCHIAKTRKLLCPCKVLL